MATPGPNTHEDPTIDHRIHPSSGLLGGALALLAGALPAQTGSYSYFGTGCGPTIPVSGTSRNMGCTSVPGLWYSTTVDFALPGRETANRTITGLTLRTRAVSRAVTTPIELWLADSQGKPLTRVRTGSITVGTTYGNHSGKFTSPYAMPAGQYYAVVFRTDRLLTVPRCSSGTAVSSWMRVLPSAFFTRNPTDLNWSYRVDFQGTLKVPVLSSSGAPLTGRATRLTVSNARPGTVTSFGLGFSRSRWGALPLPFDLGVVGASGCRIYASRDISFTTLTNGSGTAALDLFVPNQRSLVGLSFYNQNWVLDSSANKLGLAWTRAGAARIGEPCANGSRAFGGQSFGFSLPRIDFIGFPGLSALGAHAGYRQDICCSANGPRRCAYSGTGSFKGEVGQFAIPVTALGRVLGTINDKVCTTLRTVSGGSVDCSTVLGVDVGGIVLSGQISAAQDKCNNSTKYTGSGSVLFPKGVFGGAKVSAKVKVGFLSQSWSFTLGVQGTPSGNWWISGNRIYMRVRIPQLKLVGSTKIPIVNRSVNYGFTVNTPFLEGTTPGVPLPAISICK